MNYEPFIPLSPDEEETLPIVTLPHDEMKALSVELKINDALPNLVLHESTALLIDVNNFYHLAQMEGYVIDYGRLSDIFRKRCDLRHCGAFSAIDRKDPNSHHWEEQMSAMGYTPVTKDLLRYKDNRGTIVLKQDLLDYVTTKGPAFNKTDFLKYLEDYSALVTKGNLDVEMTIEALDLNPAFGHVIIGSCDGDFVGLIKRLKKDHHRKVSVLGIGNKHMAGLSKALVDAADNFYNILDLKDQVLLPARRS